MITIIDHCLEEYASGIRVPAKLNATVCSERYKNHLLDLESFQKNTPNRCNQLLKFIYNTARARALVAEDLIPQPTARLTAAHFGEDSLSDEEYK